MPKKPRTYHSILTLLSLLFLSSPAPSQTAATKTKTAGLSASERLDQWQGSSLGMSIVGFTPGHYVIEKVREGLAANLAGIKPDDLLIRVGEIDLQTKRKTDLKEYLQSVPPNTVLKVIVRRRSEKIHKPATRSKSSGAGEKTQPDAKQKAEENAPEFKLLELKLTTDPPAMLDGWMVAERLQNNRVIQATLDEKGESAKLEKLRERILNSVKRSKTPRVAYEKINQRIDELGVSHTAIIPSWGYARLTSQAKGGLGITLQRIRQDGKPRYFVIDMEAGGPAHLSPVQIGDEIISANEVPLDRSARLILAGEEQHHQLFMIAAEANQQVRIHYKQTREGPTKTALLKVDPDLTALSASKSSLRIIGFQGLKIGYYRVWNLMSMKVNSYLQDALDNQFQDCDGLIIDLRGRGGSIPVVQRMERTIKDSGLPAAVIIDKHSRSAKEILAIRLKDSPGISLVGQRTCGAVTAATFARLPSGNALMFPVTSGQRLSRYTKNINLEGRGVAPDIKVQFDRRYLQGRDPLIEAAQEQLGKLMKKVAKSSEKLQLVQ